MKNHIAKVPQIWHILMLLFSFSIPFSIKLNSVLLIITVVFSFIYYFLYPEKKNLKEMGYLLAFIALYLSCVVGLLNSQNLKPAFFDFEQKVSWVALPLIFGLGAVLSERKKKYAQMAFVVATLIICLLNYRNGFYWVYNATDETVETNLLIRRPYLGMYCVCCIFFCFELIRTTENALFKIVTILLTIFFGFFLVTLFAKMAFIVLTILLYIYVLTLLLTKKEYLMAGITLIIGISILLYGTLLNSRGREVTKKLLSFNEFDWATYEPRLVNSINLRFAKWQCTAKVLSENKTWLWGAGTGEAQLLLDACYTERFGASSFFVTEHFNSHNQYLTTWLNQGLLGLVFLLVHFGFFLRHHYRTGNILGGIFTLGIMLFCLTESIFEVQKGIILYSFFQLLLYQPEVKSAEHLITT